MSSSVGIIRHEGWNPVISPMKKFLPACRVLTGLAIAALCILPAAAVLIDPIGSYAAGDNITISGSTSFAVGDKVWVTVSASDFHPTSKYESIEQLSGESKASGTVRVTKGPGVNGQNVWSIGFPTKGWEPGEYTVRAADATGGTLLWASEPFTLASGQGAGSQGIVSPPGTGDTPAPPGEQDTNSSLSSPAAVITGRVTTPQDNGDSGLSLPLLALIGLSLTTGCGYYVMKRRIHQTIPAHAGPVLKTGPDTRVAEQPAGISRLIFLSAKSEDYAFANRVYSHLTKKGYSVFFSDQTLPRVGNSDYRREIDKALDRSKHLIVVTSRKEYVESKWVEAEWGSFINEKRSGRKDGNILVLLAGSMQIGELPISLRSFETRFLDNPDTLDQIQYYLS